MGREARQACGVRGGGVRGRDGRGESESSLTKILEALGGLEPHCKGLDCCFLLPGHRLGVCAGSQSSGVSGMVRDLCGVPSPITLLSRWRKNRLTMVQTLVFLHLGRTSGLRVSSLLFFNKTRFLYT